MSSGEWVDTYSYRERENSYKVNEYQGSFVRFYMIGRRTARGKPTLCLWHFDVSGIW